MAWAIVILVAVLSVAAVFSARKVEQDDDVLAFLPKGNQDVQVFYDVNRRFGGLDIAIAGVETDNVFSKDFLARLRTVTTRLNATEGVGYALTLTNVEDFARDAEKGGIVADYLVRAIPQNEAEEKALRERVLSRDEVVGNLVDENGKGTLIYCFAVPGTDMRAMAGRVRTTIEEVFPSETKYWGGAPFISTYIFNVTQEDLRRLGPWAVIVLVLITVLSFRDFIGTGLALLSTALGILMSLGLMGALGVRSNIVLGSMPLILLSLGSAYAVHFLSRYYSLVKKYGVEGAVQRTLTGLGPTIAASGLIAAVALLSFAVMDIAPMRTFGLFTAIGLTAKLTLALTFVPAVLVLARLQGKKKTEEHKPNRFAVGLMKFAERRRTPLRIALALTLVAAIPFALRIDTHTDNSAFFAKGSPPDRAEKFLESRFGGSQFLQVEIVGDMTNPAVLREVAQISDRITALPEVASVSNIVDILAITNDAMSGDRTIPDTAAKAKNLYGFLSGKQAVRQFVTEERDRTVMQVKLRSSRAEDVERSLAAIRSLVNEHRGAHVIASLASPTQAAVLAKARAATVARIVALAAKYKVSPPENARDALDRALAEKKIPVPTEAAEKALFAFLGSDEFIGDMPSEPADAKAKVAAAAAKLGPGATNETLAKAFTEALEPKPTDAVALDLASTMSRPLADIWRREQASAWSRTLVSSVGLNIPEGPKGERFLASLASALIDLHRESVLLPASSGAPGEALSLDVHITGQPVINEGLSQSVTRNQIRSLGFALAMVLIITSVMFRSVRTGLLAAGPAIFTVALLYASMTFIGIRLDIGTSLLASLVVGAGTDYALHALSAWEAADDKPLSEAAARSAEVAGQGIWTNALMVACGFSVLTLGEAKPLQNVGGLTAAAMVLSAFATFFIVPAFAQKHRYRRPPRMPDPVLPSDAPEAQAEGASALFETDSLINDGGSAPLSAPPNSPRS
ncbi:MAG: MMPL family transporter [Polyangiaceae bacterium]|nr:MMPL family transporter [Polyangiaceae bacterium]